jgi:hypothetical protein
MFARLMFARLMFLYRCVLLLRSHNPIGKKLLQQWINKQSKTGTFRLLQGLTGKSILKYLLG